MDNDASQRAIVENNRIYWGVSIDLDSQTTVERTHLHNLLQNHTNTFANHLSNDDPF